jgi:hypothetical protein
MKASSSSMQEIFRNIKFPVNKEQILEHARKQNASSDTIDTLEMIPDQQYDSANSLMRAMEEAIQHIGQGGGGKSQGFGGTGRGGSGGGGPSSGGSSQGFGGRGGE